MNFFAQQDRARAQTRRMLALFALAVICIVGAIDLVLMIASGALGRGRDATHGGALVPLVIFASLGVLALIGLSTLYKVLALRGGGGVVARQLGGRLVDLADPATSRNFAYKRLHNVVEEIAIASGVPVPEVYVLEDEPAINAFAAGYMPADAAVCVTRGCLDKLTRDELQGVIAHEFSHVLNGDMRLNIRLMGILFGILVIGILGRKMVEWSGRDRDSNWQIAVGIAILAVGSIGLFFGRLIKAGISRQREYLADASAVQFTRQTLGIAGALKKIGGLPDGSKLANSGNEEVAHMLFGDGVGYSSLFATHPPLTERIRAIEPNFDPQEFERIAKAWSAPVQASPEDEGAEVSLGGMLPAAAVMARGAVALPRADAAIALTPRTVVSQVAHPGSDDYRTAGAIHETFPAPLRAAAYAGESAHQLVFALALDAEAGMRARQLAIVEKNYDAATRTGVARLADAAAQLHPMQRLPLVQLAFPALRRRERAALQCFATTLDALIRADGQVQLEEYCLAKLIAVQVVDALDPSKARVAGAGKLAECPIEITSVIATVARYGNDNEAEAERAYLLGMQEVLPDAIEVYAPPQDYAAALDRALPRLDLLMPAAKELIVRALTRAIGADGVVAVSEAEMLRTICAALHCPLPPQLDLAS